MAEFTVPDRTYQPGRRVGDITAVLPVESWCEAELRASDWKAGRTVIGKIEESFNGGLTWQGTVGGTFEGPWPVVDDEGVTQHPRLGVSLPEGDRALYRMRVTME